MGQEKDFSVLEMLYDAYSESTNMSNDQIKKDFDDLWYIRAKLRLIGDGMKKRWSNIAQVL